MHELSAMVRLVQIAEEAAKKEKADRVKSVIIDIGEMTGYLPEYLIKFFPEASKGTLLTGAELKVSFHKVKIQCAHCGTEYEPSAENDRRCPVCRSMEGHIISGRELSVRSLEVEMDDEEKR